MKKVQPKTSDIEKKEEPSQLMPGGNPHWVDMVEVVRCKDCVFLNRRVGLWCGFHDSLYPTTKDYCSWGVRRAK